MPSKSGFPTPDVDLDAATETARKRIKDLNKTPARNAAERSAVAMAIAGVKDEWFLDFGRAVLRSRQ